MLSPPSVSTPFPYTTLFRSADPVAEGGQLLQSLHHAHGRTLERAEEPGTGEREERREPEREPPRARRDDGGEGDRRGDADRGKDGLLEADSRAAAAPAELGGDREREPVPGHRQAGRDGERRHEQPSRRPREDGD